MLYPSSYEDWPGPWQWLQHPQFFEDCDSLGGDPDDLKGRIGEWIEADPLGRSEPYPLSGLNGLDRRYFYTLEVPWLGLHVPKMIVYQIELHPVSGVWPITGILLDDDPDAY